MFVIAISQWCIKKGQEAPGGVWILKNHGKTHTSKGSQLSDSNTLTKQNVFKKDPRDSNLKMEMFKNTYSTSAPINLIPIGIPGWKKMCQIWNLKSFILILIFFLRQKNVHDDLIHLI